MPTLMLRGLSPNLVARLAAYAARVRVARPVAAMWLLVAGLDAHERSVAGGKARAAMPDAQDARRKGGATTAQRARRAPTETTEKHQGEGTHD